MNNPIFVVGAQRSGTTLLMMMLNGHSKIAIPHESDFIIEFYNRLNEYGDLKEKKNIEELVVAILKHWRVKEWDKKIQFKDINIAACHSYSDIISQIFSSYAKKCGKKIWGDKTPGYTLHMDILNTLFNNSIFIHIIRDGRDVALSLKGLWFDGSLLNGLYYWSEKVFVARKMGLMLPAKRYFEIRYEDLVADPEKELKKLCGFLEIEYETSMLNYSTKSKHIVGERISKHHKNLLRRPDKALTYKWKHKLLFREMALCDMIIGDRLKEFGYDLSNIHSKCIKLYHYYLIFKEGVSRRLKSAIGNTKKH